MISEKQLVVQGILTNYRITEPTGSDGIILFLHGWGDDSRTFSQLQAGLGNNITVALDLPGFGKTDPPSDSWGLNNYALFIKAFIDKLGLKPTVIIGHSNGGAIAIRGLAQKILTADKLVLLASAGIRAEYHAKKKALRLAAKGAKVLTKPLPQSVQVKIKKRAYSTIGSDLFVAEHLQETFKKVVSDDVQSDAANIKCPTLLIYGTDDTATPVKYGQLLNKALQDSTMKIIPSVGHFVHHEAPIEVLRFIRSFIEVKS